MPGDSPVVAELCDEVPADDFGLDFDIFHLNSSNLLTKPYYCILMNKGNSYIHIVMLVSPA